MLRMTLSRLDDSPQSVKLASWQYLMIDISDQIIISMSVPKVIALRFKFNMLRKRPTAECKLHLSSSSFPTGTETKFTGVLFLTFTLVKLVWNESGCPCVNTRLAIIHLPLLLVFPLQSSTTVL